MRCFWAHLGVHAQSGDAAIIRYSARHHPVVDTEGMVASQNAMASAVGAQILADGGNAIDAAVGVGFALAVVLPRAGNIGGGGFMLAYLADADETIAIDYREMAPRRAHRDMFLDEDGNVDNERARFSHKSSGVPGTVAGLHAAHERYGVPSLEAIARTGNCLGARRLRHQSRPGEFARRLDRSVWDAIRRHAAIFTKPTANPTRRASAWCSSDLATTLTAIAEEGPDAFYRGAIAELIVAEMEANDGFVDAASLADYKPVFREAAARSVSRLRHRRDAAFELRRCAHHSNAERARKVSRLRTWGRAALTTFTC